MRRAWRGIVRFLSRPRDWNDIVGDFVWCLTPWDRVRIRTVFGVDPEAARLLEQAAAERAYSLAKLRRIETRALRELATWIPPEPEDTDESRDKAAMLLRARTALMPRLCLLPTTGGVLIDALDSLADGRRTPADYFLADHGAGAEQAGAAERRLRHLIWTHARLRKALADGGRLELDEIRDALSAMLTALQPRHALLLSMVRAAEGDAVVAEDYGMDAAAFARLAVDARTALDELLRPLDDLFAQLLPLAILAAARRWRRGSLSVERLDVIEAALRDALLAGTFEGAAEIATAVQNFVVEELSSRS